MPQQVDGILFVVDDEIARQAEIARLVAEYLGAEAVKGLDTALFGGCTASNLDSRTHVFGGTVGESDAEGVLRWR